MCLFFRTDTGTYQNIKILQRIFIGVHTESQGFCNIWDIAISQVIFLITDEGFTDGRPFYPPRYSLTQSATSR